MMANKAMMKKENKRNSPINKGSKGSNNTEIIFILQP